MIGILTKLEKKAEIWSLIGLSFLFFLLRLPSLFEPYWYGDEGIYEVIGMALRHGRLLYRDIWDNKPPMLYLVYALFNGDQPTVRFVSLLSGILAVILFFYVAKALFKSSKLSLFLTTIFTILFGLPLLEGNIANAENFMLPLSLAAALIVLKASQSYNHKSKNVSSFPLILNTKGFMLFSTGFILGLSFLFKVVAVFDLAAFTLFLLFLQFTSVRKVPKQIFTIIPLYVGFVLPFSITILFFFSRHALSDFIHSAFLMNVGYVNAGNQFIIPQGLLVIKLIILAIFCIGIFFRKKHISRTNLFIILWLAFSIFNALFSQRSYTHYLLVFLASFVLFAGLITKKFLNKKTMYLQKLIYAASFFFILVFFLSNFWFYQKDIRYYQNFLTFVSGKETSTSYTGFFALATIRDYELTSYITSHIGPSDTIFIWGDNAQLYKLTNKLPIGRYMVAYHIRISPQTYEETKQILEKHKPHIVIILSKQQVPPLSLVQYKEVISIQDAIIYEHID